MSAVIDRMMGDLFSNGNGNSLLELKLTPVVADAVEAETEAKVEISKAKSEQIKMSTTFDKYRQFAKSSKSILKDLGKTSKVVDQIDADAMICNMAKEVGIELAELVAEKG